MNMTKKICKGCGQPVWGTYLNTLGAIWHPEHFVCASCGNPLQGARFQVYQDAPYHIECYTRQIAPRCVYCGKPLSGRYLIDSWGQKFCAVHQTQFPACAYCSRLVPPQQREVGSEVVRCAICRSTAVETSSEAKPLFSQVIRWMSSQGLVYLNLRLSLDLCGRAHLAQVLQESHANHSLGATTSATYTQNGRVIRTEVNGIAVLQGLPSMLFQGVTVHELGHVWFIVHGIHNLPSWAEEGFCEWLSYRYYLDANTPESLYYSKGVEQNRDPVYGEGFRRIRALIEQTGFPRFIETLQTTKHLPTR